MSQASRITCFNNAKALEKLQDLLNKSSRTFALTIPLLPSPLKEIVTIAYLLFRNADSIEDEVIWPASRRRQLLINYGNYLEDLNYQQNKKKFEQWLIAEQLIFQNPNYTVVMNNLPLIIKQLRQLPSRQQRVVINHVKQTIMEMSCWLEREEKKKKLVLTNLKEVEDYCYSVAGIVGEMLTELFGLYSSLIDGYHLFLLKHRARNFACGLQLTNMIKDYPRDLLAGRQFIPQRYLPVKIEEIEKIVPLIEYAHNQLATGINYVCLLPQGEIAIRQFCLLPLFLAQATLEQLLNNQVKLFSGEDVKINRQTVNELKILVEQIAGDDLAIRKYWHQFCQSLMSKIPE